MSLGAISTRNALVVYKGDISDLRSKHEQLKQSVRDVASVESKAATDREKHGTGAIDALGKMGLAYNALAGVVNSTLGAMKTHAERLRLENAAAGVSIDKLSEAAGGLVSRHQQLEIAAKLQHGAYSLSEKQMVDVERAMRQLTREGHNQEDVIKKVTDAVTKLEDGGLKDFGIQLRETHSDSEKFTAIMDKLAGKSREVGDGTKTAAEDMAGLGVSMEDSFDKIGGELRKLAVAMEPLIKALADAVAYVAKLAADAPKQAKEQPGQTLGGAMGGFGFLGYGFDQMGQRGVMANGNAGVALAQGLTFGVGGYSNFNPNYDLDETRALAADARRIENHAGAPQAEMYVPKARGGQRRASWSPGAAANTNLGEVGWQQQLNEAIYGYITTVSNEVAAFIAQQGIDAEEIESLAAASNIGSLSNTAGGGYGDIAIDHTKIAEDMERQYAELQAKLKQDEDHKFLEGIFGTTDEMSAYTIGIQSLAGAFDMLTGAVGASLGAWIDGSESASDAFRNFIADALKATAVQMSIEALKHGALAVGDLAIGNVAGAVLHGKAAGMAAAVAIAATAGAKLLGTSASGGAAAASSGGSAGASGGGGGYSGGSASNDNSRAPIVMRVSDDDPYEKTRMKQARFQSALERALGDAGYGAGGG